MNKVSENPMNELENKHYSTQTDNTSNKEIWLGIVLLVIFIIGVVWLFTSNHKKTSPSTNLAKSTSAIINITSFGFSPSDINVPTNTIVTWTNKDTKPHEVAADPFPKDDSIPNFNSYVVLHTNETYTFKFEKSGTYKYHDQLNPFKFNGIVKVK